MLLKKYYCGEIAYIKVENAALLFRDRGRNRRKHMGILRIGDYFGREDAS